MTAISEVKKVEIFPTRVSFVIQTIYRQKFLEENRGIFVESSRGGHASCLAIHGSPWMEDNLILNISDPGFSH